MAGKNRKSSGRTAAGMARGTDFSVPANGMSYDAAVPERRQ